jgi:hypothetical protein
LLTQFDVGGADVIGGVDGEERDVPIGGDFG